ncbi:unnamed protein product, partial [Rotaria socialis]
SSRYIGSNCSSLFELSLIRSPSIGKNNWIKKDVHAVQTRRQAKATQDSSTISFSASNSSNPVDQFDLLTVNDQLISSQFLTTAPMYNSHQPVDTFFDVCASPSYNLTPQLCFSEDSLYSDEEDEDKWLIKLEQENGSKIKNCDEKMKQEWQEALEEFQEKWNEKVKKE